MEMGINLHFLLVHFHKIRLKFWYIWKDIWFLVVQPAHYWGNWIILVGLISGLSVLFRKLSLNTFLEIFWNLWLFEILLLLQAAAVVYENMRGQCKKIRRIKTLGQGQRSMPTYHRNLKSPLCPSPSTPKCGTGAKTQSVQSSM